MSCEISLRSIAIVEQLQLLPCTLRKVSREKCLMQFNQRQVPVWILKPSHYVKLPAGNVSCNLNRKCLIQSNDRRKRLMQSHYEKVPARDVSCNPTTYSRTCQSNFLLEMPHVISQWKASCRKCLIQSKDSRKCISKEMSLDCNPQLQTSTTIYPQILNCVTLNVYLRFEVSVWTDLHEYWIIMEVIPTPSTIQCPGLSMMTPAWLMGSFSLSKPIR